MNKHHRILDEIETYLAKTGMGRTYFGKQAVNNSELVDRLRAGGSVHFRTEAEIKKFMLDHPIADTPSNGGA